MKQDDEFDLDVRLTFARRDEPVFQTDDSCVTQCDTCVGTCGQTCDTCGNTCGNTCDPTCITCGETACDTCMCA